MVEKFGVAGGTATTDKRKEALAKAKESRKIRQEKVAKLHETGKYALKCITNAKANLEMAESMILSGRPVTSEFIQVLGNIQSATGDLLSPRQG